MGKPLIGLVVIVFDSEYPEKAIPWISRVIVEEFNKVKTKEDFEAVNRDVNWAIPALETIIKRYQDPREADKLLKLKCKRQDVDKIMYKNLDDLLKRGETLEALMARSRDMNRGCEIGRGTFGNDSRKGNQECCSCSLY